LGAGRQAVETRPGLDAGSLSARLDRLPATRTVWKLLGLLSLGLYFELYDLFFTAYIAPGLVAAGIVTPSTPGLFGTSGVASFAASLFAGLFVATIAGGFLADRFGRRAIFTWSLLWYTAANLVMAFQTTASGLNLWRFVAGLGIGLEIITIGTYAAELAPKALRGRASAAVQAVGFCAVPMVSLLAYVLVPRKLLGLDGWRWIVIIGTQGALFVWWIRRRLPESPRWLAQQGRLEEADRIVSEIERRVEHELGRPLPPPAVAGDVARAGPFRDLWVPPYRRRTVMMSVFNVFQTVGYYGWATWVPTLLIKQGIGVSTSLLYTAIIALAAPVGPLLGVRFGDRFERKHVIVATALVNLVFGLVFAQARSAALVVAMGLGLTLGGNVISFSYHVYQQEIFPTGIRSRAAGFVYSWSRASAILNPFLVAFVLERTGVPGVFAFISVATVIVALTIGLFGPRTSHATLDRISAAEG
jgi:putative MFS transporter